MAILVQSGQKNGLTSFLGNGIREADKVHSADVVVPLRMIRVFLGFPY